MSHNSTELSIEFGVDMSEGTEDIVTFPQCIASSGYFVVVVVQGSCGSLVAKPT